MMLKMGAMLAGKEGARMLKNYNDVREKHLAPVIAVVIASRITVVSPGDDLCHRRIALIFISCEHPV